VLKFNETYNLLTYAEDVNSPGKKYQKIHKLYLNHDQENGIKLTAAKHGIHSLPITRM
jgi:hypothetical protein